MKKPLLLLSLGLSIVFILGLLTAFDCKRKPKIKQSETVDKESLVSSGKAAARN